MTLPIPACEIAVGDYSPEYGTVKAVKEYRDRKTNELVTVDITFWNGTALTAIKADRVYEFVQGGLTDRGPSSTVRDGLSGGKS